MRRNASELEFAVFRLIVELQAPISHFLTESNADPKHFVWTLSPQTAISAGRKRWDRCTRSIVAGIPGKQRIALREIGADARHRRTTDARVAGAERGRMDAHSDKVGRAGRNSAESGP